MKNIATRSRAGDFVRPSLPLFNVNVAKKRTGPARSAKSIDHGLGIPGNSRAPGYRPNIDKTTCCFLGSLLLTGSAPAGSGTIFSEGSFSDGLSSEGLGSFENRGGADSVT